MIIQGDETINKAIISANNMEIINLFGAQFVIESISIDDAYHWPDRPKRADVVMRQLIGAL